MQILSASETIHPNGTGRTRCLSFTASNGAPVIVTRSAVSITVIVRPSRRSLGQTFFSADAVIGHYRSAAMRADLVKAMQILNAETFAPVA